ncbi:MAG TPA: hypothetical protein VF092_08975 [Longimicrobium sp.]
MRHTDTNLGRGRKRPFPLRVAALGLLLPLGACSVDKLLEVDDPDVATPGSVQDSTASPVVYAGAVGDFALAYSGTGSTGGGGSNESQILLSGLLTDEFRSHDTFDTRVEIDQRAIVTAGANGTTSNGQLDDVERNLHRARRSAETGVELFASSGKATDRRRAELFALAGYTYIFFAENYCSGVAFSSFPVGGGAPIFGTPQTTQQILTTAIERFDSALAIAPAASIEQRLALVGKARAQLNLNDRAAAAATVAAVPTTFSYLVFHSSNTTRQENGVYNYTIDSGRYGVANLEGGNGLPFITEGETDGAIHDPRIPNNNTRPGFDPSIPDPFYSQLKYPSRDSDVPLANGIEARLIEAEAALNGGASNTYLTALNTLRASVGLAALADPGTAAGRVNQFFKEREYWLWLTSHRLGDLRRLIRYYGRTEDGVFPTGAYFRGGNYGDDVNLPIYVDEGNNPNFTGCINRNA